MKMELLSHDVTLVVRDVEGGGLCIGGSAGSESFGSGGRWSRALVAVVGGRIQGDAFGHAMRQRKLGS